MKKHDLILIAAGVLMGFSICRASEGAPAIPAADETGATGYASPWRQELHNMQASLAEAQRNLQEAIRNKTTGGMALAVPGVRMSTGNGGFRMDLGTPKEPSTSVQLIPANPAAPEVFGQLTEDLQVMSMILLDQILPPATEAPNYLSFGSHFSMGLWGRRFVPDCQAAWLDGYGVIFTLEVDFPLVPIDQQEKIEPENPAEKTDEVWQRNKDRLRGLDQPDADNDTEDVIVFDPDRVQQLREKLTEALKHAANIRNLSAKDRIIVVISSVIDGQPLSVPANEDAAVSVPTSVMTLQAAKPDIDAFATGKMDSDTFTQKVAVVIY